MTKMVKIAIQGVKASFHDVAARKFRNGQAYTPIECASFTLLSNALRDGLADCAVMAIENSIAGSILPNYTIGKRRAQNFNFTTEPSSPCCPVKSPGRPARLMLLQCDLIHRN